MTYPTSYLITKINTTEVAQNFKGLLNIEKPFDISFFVPLVVLYTYEKPTSLNYPTSNKLNHRNGYYVVTLKYIEIMENKFHTCNKEY